jgi:hypothetical protein
MAAPAIAAFGQAMEQALGPTRRLVGALNEMGQVITSGLLAPMNAVKGLADAIGPLVAKANPAVIWHFTRALDNFQAIIGQQLTPVMQGVTIWLEKMGDTMAGFTPVLQPLFDQIGQSLSDLAVILRECMIAVAPFVEVLADGLTKALKEITAMMVRQGAMWIAIVKEIARALGFESSRFDRNRKAKGAAAYTPEVSGVEDFARKQFQQSLMGVFAARGQGKKPEEHLPDIATSIAAAVRIIDDIKKDVTAIAKVFGVKNPGAAANQAAGAAAGGIGGAAADFFGIGNLFRKAQIS